MSCFRRLHRNPSFSSFDEAVRPIILDVDHSYGTIADLGGVAHT
jgi:hypothetical protein